MDSFVEMPKTYYGFIGFLGHLKEATLDKTMGEHRPLFSRGDNG
jgi:hypothetical protein